MMDKTEALCNKNADTIFEKQYNNNLSLEVFEYEILLARIENNKDNDDK